MKETSIFKKLLLYSISITLLGLALLSFILNFSLQEILYKKKETTLFRQADQLAAILQSARDTSTSGDPGKNSFYKAAVKNNQSALNIETAFILQKDKQKRAAKQRKRLLRKGDIDNPKMLKDVLSGNREAHIGTLQKGSSKKLVSVGIPVKNNGEIIGALFLYTPVKEVQTGEVSRIILIVSFLIAIPAVLTLYWVSRKISKPLIQMTYAAGMIGKGNFGERIPVESQDEVGKLASTFNQMAEQLEKLDKMRKELIVNVSHELRTPLTSVRGFIQGILEGIIPPGQQTKYLEISFQEIQRLNILLNSMLDLSAIESGRVSLNLAAIRWEPLVRSTVESIKVRMEDKNITLDFHFSSPSLKAFCDPERLKQVLFNLLDNAVRHTPQNGMISIASLETNGRLKVRIYNSGKGIQPEILSHIWERFYTEEPSRQSHRERSGIGLTITKQLVELMGGRISAESVPGEGAVFTFTLPQPPIET